MSQKLRKACSGKLVFGAALGLALLLAAAGCAPQEGSDPGAGRTQEESRRIRLGYPSVTATIFPIIYAEETGIFAQEGVRVELNRIAGIPQIVATLISGDIDAAWLGFDGMANAVVEGVEDLRYIGEFLKEMPQNLVVAPEIEKIEDLRGKPVATAGPGSLTDTLFSEGLKRGGIANPKEETEYLHLAGQNNRLTQLLNGTVVASSLKVPFAQRAEEKGYRILQYQGNLLAPWSGEGLVTRADTVSEKPEALRGLVRGMQKAIRGMAENRAEAVRIAASYMELEPALAEKVYDLMLPLFNADARWNLEGIQRMFDFRSGPDRKIDASRFLEDGFLEP